MSDVGQIYVTVTDNAGAPLPGVTVTVTGPATPQIQDTNAEGLARFLNLGPGEYELKAELEGFSRFVDSKVKVRAKDTTPVHAQLTPAGESLEGEASDSLLPRHPIIAAREHSDWT